MVKIDLDAAKDIGQADLLSLFSKEKYLSRYLNSLAQSDICTVDDIAKSETSIFDQHPTSQGNKARITQGLASIGVHIT